MTLVKVPTASNIFTINEPIRSLGSVLTLEQLDALDNADTKEASK